MTRAEAEEAARRDAEEGERRTVPAYAEGWYEAEWDEWFTITQDRRRAAARRRGIVVPWWEVL